MNTGMSQAMERLRRQKEMADAMKIIQAKLKRYEFLIELLRDRGVLHQYTDDRRWVLRGIYGVDDSGIRGVGDTIDAALDDAINARNDISKKWLDTNTDDQERQRLIEQNRSTALYIDSLIAGSNG